MAQTVTNEEGEGVRLSNSAARKDEVNSVFDKIYRIDAEIGAQTAKHIDHLKKDRKAVWLGAKKSLEMDTGALRALYKPYKMMRDARDNYENKADVDKLADTFQEAYAALFPGQTLDLVAVIERHEKGVQQAAA